eukprot:TRINITY_DN1132_c0_g1_i4.p4 TRINITY_DN1132_c0_g1~~TRINITY_DN1132_c0_g1_i4.p4  ORF type:complete len:130 (+),score=16.78 TRINITY_DN1132_c0_g1_i4:44-391(+)
MDDSDTCSVCGKHVDGQLVCSTCLESFWPPLRVPLCSHPECAHRHYDDAHGGRAEPRTWLCNPDLPYDATLAVCFYGDVRAPPPNNPRSSQALGCVCWALPRSATKRNLVCCGEH